MANETTYYTLDDEEILRAHAEALRASERELLRQELRLIEHPGDPDIQRIFSATQQRVGRIKDKHAEQKAKVAKSAKPK